MRMKLPKMAPAPKVRRYRWSSRATCAVFCYIYIALLYIPPYHMVLQVMLQVERTNSHSGSAQITELVQ